MRLIEEEDRELMIDQTRKAARFYRAKLEESNTDVLAVVSGETLFVAAIGKRRDQIIELLTAAQVLEVEIDPGGEA